MLSMSESDRKSKILEMGGDCPNCLNLNSKSILGFMPLKKPKRFSRPVNLLQLYKSCLEAF